MKPSSAVASAKAAVPVIFAARHRFALGGLALALVVAVGTPALARALSASSHLPIDASVIGIGIVMALAVFIAGWALGRSVDRLAEEARRDPVTRVGNRRHWEESLTHEVEAAATAHMPLSLLMVDVDNLKKLNDASGHSMGDRALAIVGEVLNETCRSRDVAARFGGDEFGVLLPRTRASEAEVVAERIRTALGKRRMEAPTPIDTLLTVSIGIADLATIAKPSAHLLFDAADKALYEAKAAGRDRVQMHQPARQSSVIDLEERRRQRATAPTARSRS